MSLNRYPTSFPTTEAAVVVNKILGRAPEPALEDAIEAAWWVVGYGASKATPSDVSIAGETTPTEVAAFLESAGAGVAVAAAFPWESLIPVLVEIIQEWRKGRGKK